jgi:hypothetical protein
MVRQLHTVLVIFINSTFVILLKPAALKKRNCENLGHVPTHRKKGLTSCLRTSFAKSKAFGVQRQRACKLNIITKF